VIHFVSFCPKTIILTSLILNICRSLKTSRLFFLIPNTVSFITIICYKFSKTVVLRLWCRILPYIPVLFINELKQLWVSIVPKSLTTGHTKGIKFIELDGIPQPTDLSLVWNKTNRNPLLNGVIDVVSTLTQDKRL